MATTTPILSLKHECKNKQKIPFTYKVPANAKRVANIDASIDIPGLKTNSSPEKIRLLQPFWVIHIFGSTKSSILFLRFSTAHVAIVGALICVGWLRSEERLKFPAIFCYQLRIIKRWCFSFPSRYIQL